MKNAAENDTRDAQELVYDAWETPDPEKAFKLFEQALETDKTNEAGCGPRGHRVCR